MMKSAQIVGAISDTEMREFEKDCFVEEPEKACETEAEEEGFPIFTCSRKKY
jgi:hypothetical protein